MLKFLLYLSYLAMSLLKFVLTATLEYPAESLVRLKLVHENNLIKPTDVYCTGTILNAVYILTHTACFKTFSSKSIKSSVAFINTMVGDEAKGMNKRNITWYRQVSNGSHLHDMALVELIDTHIEFSDYVHPAVLYFGDITILKKFLGAQECVVMGWNGVASGVYISYFVHTVTISNVTIIGEESCRDEYPELKEMICVRIKEDVCDLELGSPLVCGSEGKWLFLGYYTGLKSCKTPSKLYAFQTLGDSWEWMNTTSRGVYFLTSGQFLGMGSLRSNSFAIITSDTFKLLVLLICLLLVS